MFGTSCLRRRAGAGPLRREIRIQVSADFLSSRRAGLSLRSMTRMATSWSRGPSAADGRIIAATRPARYAC